MHQSSEYFYEDSIFKGKRGIATVAYVNKRELFLSHKQLYPKDNIIFMNKSIKRLSITNGQFHHQL